MMRALAARGRPRFGDLGAGPQIVVLVLVLGLVGAMAIEPTRQLIEQRRRIDGMAGEVARIEELNGSLERRIERLKDPDFIEQRARAQVGLVRPGETTFVVMPPTKRERDEKSRRAAARKATVPVPEPEPRLLDSFLAFVGF